MVSPVISCVLRWNYRNPRERATATGLLCTSCDCEGLAGRRRPIVPDPAGQAFLADLAGGKREDDGRGVRGIGLESNSIFVEEYCHCHEGDALIAIDEGVIFREPKGIGSRKFSHLRLFVPPFIDRTLKRRPQHAFITQARSSAEAAQLAAMDCDGLLVSDPERLVRLAHGSARLIWRAPRACPCTCP